MENNNQPPFAVGQPMVRIGHSGGGVLVKGNVYHCAGNHKCKCGKWHTYVKEFTAKGKAWCPDCLTDLPFLGYRMDFSEYFAPLNPPRVSAIPELLKAPVEERLDLHPVKILTDVPK